MNHPAIQTAARPRIGFLGVGWIGRHRLEAIARSERVEIAAIADPLAEAVDQAAACAPGCQQMDSLDALLAAGLDGVVIATPSAFHAEQAIRALEAGAAVFCQKPLGRDAAEARRVVDAARAVDRLLGVDLSYRHVRGMAAVRRAIQEGELGEVFAVNLVFHNAYGPDKAWFYDPLLSGGGCLIDLGIHLVDLALWTLGFPEVTAVTSQLFGGGRRLRSRGVDHSPGPSGTDEARAAQHAARRSGSAETATGGGLIDTSSGPRCLEDYAVAQLSLEGGAAVQLACSWKLSAGRDCVIEASFYGTRGGASLKNVNGSFYDFTVERYRGTARELLAEPPDAWGGRAAVAWAERLAQSPRFDPEIESVVDVAHTLDRIYQR